MKRVGRLACGLAVLVVVTSLSPQAFARALIIYPLQGQSAQQQEDDRAACADFAAATSGYNPSGLPIIVRPGAIGGYVTGPIATPPIVVPTPSGPVVASAPPPAGLIGGIVNRKQAAALDALYANYLAAGATCLTARGYQVSM
ncbi:MAG: hypothetical protein ACLQF1_15095 [Methyloceanibacter sp.]|jgi:hypothetical protein